MRDMECVGSVEGIHLEACSFELPDTREGVPQCFTSLNIY